MKRPEEVRVEFTQEWARKAERDFVTAEHLVKSGEAYVDGAAFHAQQAAEKYLKAFLIWHQIEFQKTHDVATLLRLATAVASDLAQALEDIGALTPYGVEYRYPGDYPDVTMSEAEAAVHLASRVRADIRKRLPPRALE